QEVHSLFESMMDIIRRDRRPAARGQAESAYRLAEDIRTTGQKGTQVGSRLKNSRGQFVGLPVVSRRHRHTSRCKSRGADCLKIVLARPKRPPLAMDQTARARNHSKRLYPPGT